MTVYTKVITPRENVGFLTHTSQMSTESDLTRARFPVVPGAGISTAGEYIAIFPTYFEGYGHITELTFHGYNLYTKANSDPVQNVTHEELFEPQYAFVTPYGYTTTRMDFEGEGTVRTLKIPDGIKQVIVYMVRDRNTAERPEYPIKSHYLQLIEYKTTVQDLDIDLVASVDNSLLDTQFYGIKEGQDRVGKFVPVHFTTARNPKYGYTLDSASAANIVEQDTFDPSWADRTEVVRHYVKNVIDYNKTEQLATSELGVYRMPYEAPAREPEHPNPYVYSEIMRGPTAITHTTTTSTLIEMVTYNLSELTSHRLGKMRGFTVNMSINSFALASEAYRAYIVADFKDGNGATVYSRRLVEMTATGALGNVVTTVDVPEEAKTVTFSAKLRKGTANATASITVEDIITEKIASMGNRTEPLNTDGAGIILPYWSVNTSVTNVDKTAYFTTEPFPGKGRITGIEIRPERRTVNSTSLAISAREYSTEYIRYRYHYSNGTTSDYVQPEMISSDRAYIPFENCREVEITLDNNAATNSRRNYVEITRIDHNIKGLDYLRGTYVNTISKGTSEETLTVSRLKEPFPITAQAFVESSLSAASDNSASMNGEYAYAATENYDTKIVSFSQNVGTEEAHRIMLVYLWHEPEAEEVVPLIPTVVEVTVDSSMQRIASTTDMQSGTGRQVISLLTEMHTKASSHAIAITRSFGNTINTENATSVEAYTSSYSAPTTSHAAIGHEVEIVSSMKDVRSASERSSFASRQVLVSTKIGYSYAVDEDDSHKTVMSRAAAIQSSVLTDTLYKTDIIAPEKIASSTKLGELGGKVYTARDNSVNNYIIIPMIIDGAIIKEIQYVTANHSGSSFYQNAYTSYRFASDIVDASYAGTRQNAVPANGVCTIKNTENKPFLSIGSNSSTSVAIVITSIKATKRVEYMDNTNYNSLNTYAYGRYAVQAPFKASVMPVLTKTTNYSSYEMLIGVRDTSEGFIEEYGNKVISYPDTVSGEKTFYVQVSKTTGSNVYVGGIFYVEQAIDIVAESVERTSISSVKNIHTKASIVKGEYDAYTASRIAPIHASSNMHVNTAINSFSEAMNSYTVQSRKVQAQSHADATQTHVAIARRAHVSVASYAQPVYTTASVSLGGEQFANSTIKRIGTHVVTERSIGIASYVPVTSSYASYEGAKDFFATSYTKHMWATAHTVKVVERTVASEMAPVNTMVSKESSVITTSALKALQSSNSIGRAAEAIAISYTDDVQSYALEDNDKSEVVVTRSKKIRSCIQTTRKAIISVDSQVKTMRTTVAYATDRIERVERTVSSHTRNMRTTSRYKQTDYPEIVNLSAIAIHPLTTRQNDRTVTFPVVFEGKRMYAFKFSSMYGTHNSVGGNYSTSQATGIQYGIIKTVNFILEDNTKVSRSFTTNSQGISNTSILVPDNATHIEVTIPTTYDNGSISTSSTGTYRRVVTYLRDIEFYGFKRPAYLLNGKQRVPTGFSTLEDGMSFTLKGGAQYRIITVYNKPTTKEVRYQTRLADLRYPSQQPTVDVPADNIIDLFGKEDFVFKLLVGPPEEALTTSEQNTLQHLATVIVRKPAEIDRQVDSTVQPMRTTTARYSQYFRYADSTMQAITMDSETQQLKYVAPTSHTKPVNSYGFIGNREERTVDTQLETIQTAPVSIKNGTIGNNSFVNGLNSTAQKQIRTVISSKTEMLPVRTSVHMQKAKMEASRSHMNHITGEAVNNRRNDARAKSRMKPIHTDVTVGGRITAATSSHTSIIHTHLKVERLPMATTFNVQTTVAPIGTSIIIESRALKMRLSELKMRLKIPATQTDNDELLLVYLDDAIDFVQRTCNQVFDPMPPAVKKVVTQYVLHEFYGSGHTLSESIAGMSQTFESSDARDKHLSGMLRKAGLLRLKW